MLSSEARASISRMKPTDTPSTASVAARRTRRTLTSRAPSAPSPLLCSMPRLRPSPIRERSERPARCEPSSAPRISAIGGRRLARSAGQAEASTGISAVSDQQAQSGPISPAPGASSLIASSRRRLAPSRPESRRARRARPRHCDDRRLERACSAMCARLAPKARRSPIPGAGAGPPRARRPRASCRR